MIECLWKGGDNVKKQTILPGLELVDIKVRLERDKRDKLAILARIHKQTMQQFVYELVDKALSQSKELKALAQIEKDS